MDLNALALGFGDAFSGTLANFIAAENFRNVVLIGHSMGGVLRLMTAGRRPEA